MPEVKKIATRESYGKALVELGKEHENLVVLDADLAAATKTGLFQKEFPERHLDCGMLIYDSETQDTHAGGSGCGCAAVTLCAKILPEMLQGTWKRVLFVPTGALLSTVSYNEGLSIPGIAHGVILERIGGKKKK